METVSEQKKILLVDDEPKVLDGLKRMLYPKRAEWDLSFAVSSTQALQKLAETSFDVAVMDVKMPGKGGLDMLPEIKADARTRDIEVIIITGLDDQNLKRRALDLGAADLLSKPVQKEDLIARISNALCIKSYHDMLNSQNSALEQQLFQSQKMEVIGTLAAGVAHDVKNMLSAIMLNSDMLSYRFDNEHKAQQSIERISTAGERAKKIVQQIVWLSRQTPTSYERCDLARIIDDSVGLLRSSINKKVNIEWKRTDGCPPIQADETQIFQILLNLCINAGHAMENGGVLTISLSKAELKESEVPPGGETASGEYLKLEISDTGDGMDQETLDRIFEPSFTTRESTGGSGIGLTVVKRIVASHRGHIKVRSQPGEGTAFTIMLPAAQHEQPVN